ncbi:MAG: hypothetical protein WAK13_07370 [Terriglobales bacterium]
MKIDVPLRARRFEPRLNLAVPRFLSDMNGQEIGRYVPADFKTERLPNSEASGSA